MKEKTVLVTGANQGIGKATALALARSGARVVLVARSAVKGRVAVADLQRAAESDRVELIVADLSSQAEIRRASAEFKARHDWLDVLVNNAGVLVPRRQTTIDGVEETFATNHLASFLLTNELMDVLRASGAARIVNVSSDAHRPAQMLWSDLEFANTPYGGWRAYGQSKLANILFTYELARRLSGTRVTANALHPGTIGSGFGKTYGGPTALLLQLARPFLSTPDEGARTSVYLASSPEVEGVSGRYFARCKAVDSSPLSYDPPSQRKLWALSQEMVRVRSRAA